MISISWSTVISFPLIGSTPLSAMYFSTSRRSNTDPDTGETTGCSGTSLDTRKDKNKPGFNYKIIIFICFCYHHCAKRNTKYSFTIKFNIYVNNRAPWLKCATKCGIVAFGYTKQRLHYDVQLSASFIIIVPSVPFTISHRFKCEPFFFSKQVIMLHFYF